MELGGEVVKFRTKSKKNSFARTMELEIPTGCTVFYVLLTVHPGTTLGK